MSNPSSRSQKQWRNGLVLLLVVGVVVVAGGAFGVWQVMNKPWLLWDEWQCNQGEAPVLTTGGGSYCLAIDGTPDAGQRWDPFGNRPFDCQNRDGWLEVTRDDPDGDADTRCVRVERPVPEGWTLIDG